MVFIRKVGLFVATTLLLAGCTTSTSAPQPTPRVGPTDTPRPITLGTFPVPSGQTCTDQSKVAVQMLVDTSGSMGSDPGLTVIRLPVLKRAVLDFSTFLSDKMVIGVDRFGGIDATVVVPTNTWATHKATFAEKINSLTSRGATPMRTGFLLSQKNITEAKPQYPGYQWVLVFLSDGRPNPENTETPTDVTNQLKQNGVRIITIGLDIDNAEDQALIRNLASSPQDAYEETTTDKLQEIYRKIAQTICK